MRMAEGRLFFEEAYAAPYPFLVFVVTYADHLSLAEAGQVDGQGRTGGAILPQIHHPDLCFGRDVRRWDQIGVDDLALQDPVFGVFDGCVRQRSRA